MKENKKERKSNFKKTILKVLIVQFLLVVGLILIDLYLFRGHFTSGIIIQPDPWGNNQNYSCELKIEKKGNNKYLFKFKNNSLIPKYFVNYRNEEYFQSVSDTLFFAYLRKNLFPAYGFDYYKNFDCGTGLGYTSINPLESFEIEKSYEDIIKESSYRNTLEKSDFFHKKMKKSYRNLKYEEIDSLLKHESELVLATDSIKVEYYMVMESFVSKREIYTVSNKINVSIKDLLKNYKIENSEK